MNGQWVTLHIQHFGGGEDRRLVGYLVQDGSTPGYKLTKLAVSKPWVDGNALISDRTGILTTIHEGTWIIAPQFVWMVEYEDTAPVAGFALDGV